MSDPTHIRTMHPAGFRSGEWARILTIAPQDEWPGDCYVVQFPDGRADYWVVDDADAAYEFRSTPHVPSEVK